MTISTSLSTSSVAYFLSDGTSAASAEADGAEFAVITATILDTGSAAVAGAQVLFTLDPATPDRTARIFHQIASQSDDGPASITDGSGVATCIVRSQDADNSPLTIFVRAGENTGNIEGVSAPTSSSTGATGSHGTTIAVPTTVTVGTVFTDTLFTAAVIIATDSVTFSNCTFDGGGTVANLVTTNGNTDIRFDDCSWLGSTGNAIAGYGFDMRRGYMTDIGASGIASRAVNADIPTRVFDSLIERCGRVVASAAITQVPGGQVFVFDSKLDCPHEDSTNAIATYSGRGALAVSTSRPHTASAFTLERCWLYGGDDAVLSLTATDDANVPSGLTVNSCRFGAAADNQNPAGDLVEILGSPIGFIAQGNVADADGQLIAAVNNRGGVGWYWAAEFIDVPQVIEFDPEPIPEGTVIPPNTTPTVEAPGADAEGAFITTTYLNPTLGQARPPAAQPLGSKTFSAGGTSGGTEEGDVIFADPFRDLVPTARQYPTKRAGDVAPYSFEVEFNSDDQFVAVQEANIVVPLTIDATGNVVNATTVTITYTGTATLDEDYTAPSTVVIPAGNFTIELPITIINDELAENTETIIATISAVSDGLIGDANVATITLTDFDNDFGAPVAVPDVFFSTTFVSVEEGELAEFTISMTDTLVGATTVTYSIEDSTLAASDYTDVTGGSVIIASGQTTTTVQIQTIEDTIVENTETLTLRIDTVSGVAQLGTQLVAFLEVTDNDFVKQAEVGFANATSTVFEGLTNVFNVVLSSPADGDITVAYTEVLGPGLSGGEYTLLDRLLQPLASPFTIQSGQSVFQIVMTTVDDVLVELDETLTINLGTVTGNATLGAGSSHVVTILDNDTSGPGADGDLYGLIPERQTLDFVTPDIEVYTNRYEIVANVGLGISASTVFTGQPLPDAITASESIWELLNPGNIATLQDYTTGRLAEGNVVRLRIHGDFRALDHELFLNGTGNTWSCIWDAEPYPFLRDICIYGATGPGTDYIGFLTFAHLGADIISGGPYDGRTRGATNIRFERLSIEGVESFSRALRASVVGVALDRPESSWGAVKFYNIRWETPRDHTGGFNGRGIKWQVRVRQLRVAWDYRQCSFALAEEHGVYVDSPDGFFYSVGNACDRDGFGRTFNQIVNRINDVPGLSGNGPFVFMRNQIWDTASGSVQQGGGDLTVVGGTGPFYFVENEHLGLAAPQSTARAGITVWADANRDSGKGIHVQTFNGFDYTNGHCFMYGEIVALETGTERGFFGFSSAVSLTVRGFRISDGITREQFSIDKLGTSNTQSMEYDMGVPTRHPTHGIFWDLRWPTWQDEAWTGSRSSYPGWATTAAKIKSGRARRTGNTNSHNRILSSSELEVYDGEVTWNEGEPNFLPEAKWSAGTAGTLVGVSVSFTAGSFSKTRSQYAQVWTYTRQVENISTSDFTETVNSIISRIGSEASGTMSFTMLDDVGNDELPPEMPQFDIMPTGAPINSNEPGIIRYQLQDIGPNARMVDDTIDFYIYAAGSLSTFQWDTVRYGDPASSTASIAGGTQYVYISSSANTFMREEVTISINASSTTSASGINNFTWTKASGADEIRVRLTGTSAASVGETLILDIDSVEVSGQTGGNLGSNSQITITYVA